MCSASPFNQIFRAFCPLELADSYSIRTANLLMMLHFNGIAQHKKGYRGSTPSSTSVLAQGRYLNTSVVSCCYKANMANSSRSGKKGLISGRTIIFVVVTCIVCFAWWSSKADDAGASAKCTCSCAYPSQNCYIHGRLVRKNDFLGLWAKIQDFTEAIFSSGPFSAGTLNSMLYNILYSMW